MSNEDKIEALRNLVTKEESQEETPEEPEIPQQEEEEETKVPANISDVLTLFKQDLKDYLQPLPESLMKQLEKINSNVTGTEIDFASLVRELPKFCNDVKVHVTNKQKDIRNTENNVLRILNDFENRTTKAEAKAKGLEEQNKEIVKSNSSLIEKLTASYDGRLTDIKMYHDKIAEDPVRKAAETMLNKTINSLITESAFDVKIKELEVNIAKLQDKMKSPSVESELKLLKEQLNRIKKVESESQMPEELPKEPEPEEEKVSWKDRIIQSVAEAEDAQRDIRQVDIVNETGYGKADVCKIVAKLCKEGVLKKTKNNLLKLA